MRSNRNGKRKFIVKNKKRFRNFLIIVATIVLIFILLIGNKIISKNKVSIDNNQISESKNIVQEQNVLNENNENVENNFQESQNEVSEQEPTTTFTMAVTGDIMCHNTMYQDAYNSKTKKYDFSYMFDDIKYHIQTADIAIGNLETTFAGAKVGYSGYPTFNTPEVLASNLKKAGFDVVSTANNHCIDKGYNGLVSTIEELDKADLSHTGTFTSEEAQKDILIKNVKGVKIAFLSFTYGTNGISIPKGKEYSVNLIDEDLILEQLKLAKEKKPDVICVCMHWGIEYQTTPNKEQKKLADLLFNNGADIILGNHPHVPQNMEKRTIKLDDGTTKDGFVIYSLGNFMANQNKTYTQDTAILNIQITKNNENGKISIDKAEYTPVYIYKDSSKSSKKFKLIDIEKAIENYDAGVDTSIGKTLYNKLKNELKSIKKIIGEEIN